MIYNQSCISRFVLSASDICGDMFDADDTVCGGDTILHNKQQQSDVIQNWSVRKERDSYLLHTRKLNMDYLQILLKPVESMNCSMWLLSIHLLQQNRQSPVQKFKLKY